MRFGLPDFKIRIKRLKILNHQGFKGGLKHPIIPEAVSIEFESRLKFETQLKYGWFHLKLYSMFQDFSQRSIKTHLDQIFYNFKS